MSVDAAEELAAYLDEVEPLEDGEPRIVEQIDWVQSAHGEWLPVLRPTTPESQRTQQEALTRNGKYRDAEGALADFPHASEPYALGKSRSRDAHSPMPHASADANGFEPRE